MYTYVYTCLTAPGFSRKVHFKKADTLQYSTMLQHYVLNPRFWGGREKRPHALFATLQGMRWG